MGGAVFIVIKGGLGNQLFQAAFGIGLKHSFGVDVRCITDLFSTDQYGRALLLDRFPALDIVQVPAKLANGLPIVHDRDLKPAAVKDVLRQHPSVVLSGYWQHEGYFFGQEAAIRRAFHQMMDPASIQIGSELREKGAIGIHIRRSEYGHHGLAKANYYRSAIQTIRRERGNRPAVCFSDEPNFCSAVFQDVPDLLIARGNVTDPMQDFYLLSSCVHFVIANSSFSWWAAWLGAKEESLVYAPAPWCAMNDANPIPPRWRRVDEAVQLP
jgi:hypothetical protein